jgi:hypothetical protein
MLTRKLELSPHLMLLPIAASETRDALRISALRYRPNQTLPARRKLPCVLRWAFRPRSRMKNRPVAAGETRDALRISALQYRPNPALPARRKLRCVSQWFRCPALRCRSFSILFHFPAQENPR